MAAQGFQQLGGFHHLALAEDGHVVDAAVRARLGHAAQGGQELPLGPPHQDQGVGAEAGRQR